MERTREELSEDDRERVEAIHPVDRIGNPEDVAASVALLTSDEASFITGTSLLVDDGHTTVMQNHTYLEYKNR